MKRLDTIFNTAHSQIVSRKKWWNKLLSTVRKQTYNDCVNEYVKDAMLR